MSVLVEQTIEREEIKYYEKRSFENHGESTKGLALIFYSLFGISHGYTRGEVLLLLLNYFQNIKIEKRARFHGVSVLSFFDFIFFLSP
jgi:hypothetical protein